MKCKESPYEGLMSWLKFFDIDYLDSSVCNQLSDLDINSPVDSATAIVDFFAVKEISLWFYVAVWCLHITRIVRLQLR